MRRAPALLRPSIATALVLLIAVAAFAQVTRGFQAVTTDSARRIDLVHAPRLLPPIALLDSANNTVSLSDAQGQVTFITFVYTSCVTICRTSASGQAYLQSEIRKRGLEQHVKLLTLSFDPSHDKPAILEAYSRKLDADPKIWRFATVANPGDLGALLKLFNIFVLPDALGGYSHNAALFMSDQRGRLVRAYDVDRPDLALADLLQQVGG